MTFYEILDIAQKNYSSDVAILCSGIVCKECPLFKLDEGFALGLEHGDDPDGVCLLRPNSHEKSIKNLEELAKLEYLDNLK